MRKSIVMVFATVVLISGWLGAFRNHAQGQVATTNLPTLVYLGEGAATYNEPGWNFIVKRLNPYRFEFVNGPTYTATGKERVWRSMGTNGAPPAVYHVDAELGFMEKDCIIEYLVIDDDVDGRVNHFYLDDEFLLTIPEGMVSKGQVVLPRSGNLKYDSNDSIAMYISLCDSKAPPVDETSTPDGVASTPSVTPTLISTSTEVPTVIASATPLPTGTATVDIGLTLTPTVEQTAVFVTPTIAPNLTITPNALTTATPTPIGTSVPTVTPTRHPTRVPVKACLRINFEVGDGAARAGRYDVVEVGGRLLHSWEAQSGWQDSGWIYGIGITFDAVYVDVIFVPADGGPAITMRILNPAPGTNHGWLSNGVCHAIEVDWP